MYPMLIPSNHVNVYYFYGLPKRKDEVCVCVCVWGGGGGGGGGEGGGGGGGGGRGGQERCLNTRYCSNGKFGGSLE